MKIQAFPALANASLARRFWRPLFDDPAMRARFKTHAGKTACVTALGSALHYAVSEEGVIDIQTPEEGDSAPDLNMVISLEALRALLAHDESWRSLVHRDGDAALAEDFMNFWQSVPMLLEHWAGQALSAPLFDVAHRVGSSGKEALNDFAERFDVQKRDAVAQVVAGQREHDAGAQQLRALAQRAAALEARLAVLESVIEGKAFAARRSGKAP